MLVTLKELLKAAQAKNCAIGAFNTPNLESLMAVLQAAEKLGEPVIIMHAEIHDALTPISVIGPIMVDMAKKANIPVCVHLDHGTDLDFLRQALSLGFTSIMYDGSALAYEKNLEGTRRAVAMAAETGASVEAEIGVMRQPDTDKGEYAVKAELTDDSALYTDPQAAKEFVESTGIDALACAFGTVHGIYLKAPKLDFLRIAKISSLVNVPIVMHGGSGVSKADYQKAIANGVRKINYYTYMSKAGGDAVKEKIRGRDTVFYHEIVACGIKAMEENVTEAMKIFSGK